MRAEQKIKKTDDDQSKKTNNDQSKWMCVDDALALFTETQRVLAAVESNGIKIDVPKLNENIAAVDQIIADHERQLAETVLGQMWVHMFRTPSWSNRNELGALLFGSADSNNAEVQVAERFSHIVGSNERGLRLPVTERTKSGEPSLEDDVLKRLGGEHPDHPELKIFLDIYSRYQTLLKLRSTYLTSMLKYMDAEGFIHPSFNLLGVVTYRTCIAFDTDILVCDYFGREESVKKCRIERIRPGDYVYCVDDNLQPAVSKVINQWKTGEKPVIRLHYTMHNGAPGYLDCTPEHRIRMADGEYCEAKDVLTYKSNEFKPNSPYHRYVLSMHAPLKQKYRHGKYPKEHIDPVELSIYEINRIEDLGKTVAVYDIEVQGYHNFIANEVCVHNSANSPNIQNVPTRNPIIKKYVRTIFVPRGADRHFVEVDYSGAEVRTNASINNDQTLVKSITEGLDFHKWVAAKIYLLDESEVTKLLRQSVKGDFTFAAFYGSYWKQMALKLWDTITMEGLKLKDGTLLYDHLRSKGITCLSNGAIPMPGSYEHIIQQTEAEFWNVLFKDYAKWKHDVVKKQLTTGYVDSPSGFRAGGILDKKFVTNMPAQCSAAHCLLFALCGVQMSLERLKKPDGEKMFPGSLIIGEIHDSLLADVPSDELELFLQLCHFWMCERTPQVYSWLSVPMEIEAEVAPAGEPWANKKPHEINVNYDKELFALKW